MDFDPKQKRTYGKTFHRKQLLSKEVKKSILHLMITLTFLIIILGIVYMLNTTQSSQKGYILQNQRLEKDHLEMKQRALIQDIINAKSIRNLEEHPIIKNMQKPENPIYIKE